MRYAVIWTKDAEDELASAWLNASDRNALTHTIDQLERDLIMSLDRW